MNSQAANEPSMQLSPGQPAYFAPKGNVARFIMIGMILVTIGLPACANFYRPPMAPNDAYAQYLMTKYSGQQLGPQARQAQAAFEEIHRKFEQAPTKAEKTALRNQIVNELVYLVNDYYDKYEVRWFATSAGVSAFSDITTLTLDTAVAASSGQQIRTILSALSTGVGGSKLALEKDVLKNQSITVIIHAMRAAREKSFSNLQLKLKAQDINDYPLQEALVDVQGYFRAGTVVGALQELDNAAANTDRLAKDVNDQTARLKSLVDLRAALKAARAGADSSSSPSPTAAPVP
jgi:hypothetical protein